MVLAVSALATAVLSQAQAVNCAGKLREGKVEALLSGGVAQPAKSTRVNPKDELTYVWIPPGTFSMGLFAGRRRMPGRREACAPGDNHERVLDRADGGDASGL